MLFFTKLFIYNYNSEQCRKHCFTEIGFVWGWQFCEEQKIVRFLKPIPHVTEHWLHGRAVHLSRSLWRCWTSGASSCRLLDTGRGSREGVDVKTLGDRQGGMSGHGSWSGGLVCPSQFMSGRANSLLPDTQITERFRKASSPQVTGHSCQGPIHHLLDKSCVLNYIMSSFKYFHRHSLLKICKYYNYQKRQMTG